MASLTKNTVKTILQNLADSGDFLLFAMEPRPLNAFRRALYRYDMEKRGNLEYKDKKRFHNAFNYLKKEGLIDIVCRGKQIHIFLTEEGKRKAGKYKINDLELVKQKRWDKKWRILIFDIEDKQKIKREALRGKIKELNMYQLQKSVWVYPYDFTKEMKLLREFFGLTGAEMNLIEATKIEDDGRMREYFGI